MASWIFNLQRAARRPARINYDWKQLQKPQATVQNRSGERMFSAISSNTNYNHQQITNWPDWTCHNKPAAPGTRTCRNPWLLGLGGHSERHRKHWDREIRTRDRRHKTLPELGASGTLALEPNGFLDGNGHVCLC